MELIYDPLINLDSNYEMTPMLADKWDSSSDGTIWTFHLRDDVLFHDGTPLTSQDVAFTFQVILKQNPLIYSHITNNVVSISKDDNLRVIFRLKKSDRIFPFFLRRVYIAPKHLFDMDGKPSSQADPSRPVGSGAFRVAKPISKDNIFLENNSNYFRGGSYMEKIAFHVIEDKRKLLAEMIKGNLDVNPYYDFKYLPTLRDIPHLQQIEYRNQHLLAIFLNMKNPLFQGLNVRQALNFAIRKRTDAGETIAASVVPPKSPYYDATIESYAYDPGKALELFSRAGWTRDAEGVLRKRGRPFYFEIIAMRGSEYQTNLVKMLLQDLEQIGIKTEVSFLPMDEAVVTVIQKRNFDAVLFPFSNKQPIDFDYLWWVTEKSNFTSYHNESVKKYLDEARYAPSKEASLNAYHRYQRAIHDDPPMIFLNWRDQNWLFNARVHGLNTDPFHFFSDMNRVWVEGQP